MSCTERLRSRFTCAAHFRAKPADVRLFGDPADEERRQRVELRHTSGQPDEPVSNVLKPVDETLPTDATSIRTEGTARLEDTRFLQVSR